MKVNRKFVLALLAVPAAVLVFMPWNTTVVPAVRVQVFDESGKPGPGIRVEQSIGG